eukprot:3545142-Pyramimonas_sp.AAC.1
MVGSGFACRLAVAVTQTVVLYGASLRLHAKRRTLAGVAATRWCSQEGRGMRDEEREREREEGSEATLKRYI